jgi:glutathione S-transferase
MLELYHWEPNIFFLKPLIALAEKAAPYQGHYFDPTRFEQFAAGFPANTQSRLQLEREGPVLVAEGAILTSSFFVLEYIAENCTGPTLLPAAPYDRYRARAWGQRIALSVAGAVTTLGCARYLTPLLQARPAASLRAAIASIEPLDRRAAWEGLLEADRSGAIESARGQLAAPLRRIEAALAAERWLAGPAYSIADIDAYAMLAPLPELAPELVNASVSPRIIEFLERVHSRPAVRAALAMTRSGRPEQAFVPGPEPPRWG